MRSLYFAALSSLDRLCDRWHLVPKTRGGTVGGAEGRSDIEERRIPMSDLVMVALAVGGFALLAGYGAEAVHPYLALETVTDLAARLPVPLAADAAIAHFIKAIGKGLLKVMSKMGISTYMSYTGAQIFEVVGLQKAFVDKYFYGTRSQVEGIGVF